jgi:hypothetical protein
MAIFYLQGFFHRDVSIGNVLLTVGESKSEPFTIDTSLIDTACPAPGDDTLVNADAKPEQLEATGAAASQEAIEIMNMVVKLSAETKCTAFVTDGDMAAEWTIYFENEHVGIRSVRIFPPFLSPTFIDLYARGHQNSCPYVSIDL